MKTISTLPIALALLLAACGDNGNSSGDANNTTVPTVVTTVPSSSATGVTLNASVNATFNEAMDSTSLTASTFTLSAASGVVDGTVIYADSTAVFLPAVHLASNAMYTATVTTGAKSASGIALAANYTWSFSTGTTLGALPPVNLRSAGNFVILANSAISTVPMSAVKGDIAVSPAAATYITGFDLMADSTTTFATSSQVNGKVYAASYTAPTPSKLTTAVNEMLIAFTDASGRAPDVTELGAGNIGGMTLVPGVYKWETGLLIPTDVTLAGNATDVWIFQVAQNLTMSSAKRITLSGGALANNVFWAVAGAVDIGTTAHVEGIILSKTAIALHTGSSINGRLLAQTAVSIDGSMVVQPAP